MTSALLAEIDRYRQDLPLAEACTPPASWYVDPRFLDLELETTFANSWQYACRLDQVREPGRFVTLELAGEPLLVVRGDDGVLRGFFNVCRHHAAAVVTEPSGCAKRLRCPYHGWTYTLEGDGAECSLFENHQRAIAGLPLGGTGMTRHSLMFNWIGGLPPREAALAIDGLHWHEYGKQVRPGRKVGHTTLAAPSAAALRANAEQLAALAGGQFPDLLGTLFSGD